MRLPFCRPAGEACSSDDACCSLFCSGGFCSPLMWCKPSFEPCENDRDCCSFKCKEDVAGFKRCNPAGGCRTSGNVETSKGALNLYGEICSTGCDCCSGVCEPDEMGVSRCKKLGDPRSSASSPVCLPYGEICETDSECCGDICREARPPDEAGQFPKRCLHDGQDAACRADGADCADSSECCSLMCLPIAGGCGFRCGPPTSGGSPDGGVGGAGGSGGSGSPTCVAYGGTCTQESDCCGVESGVTCAPAGGGTLVCRIPAG
jgi:hypothetical protein